MRNPIYNPQVGDGVRMGGATELWVLEIRGQGENLEVRLPRIGWAAPGWWQAFLSRVGVEIIGCNGERLQPPFKRMH